METLCEIYVSGFRSEKELLEFLKEFFKKNSPVLKGRGYIFFDCGKIYVDHNDSFRLDEQRKFPDGFLYFPFILEVDLYCDSFQEAVNIINKLLESFWARGKPAVAVSDFDEKLTFSGGYNCREVPFPG